MVHEYRLVADEVVGRKNRNSGERIGRGHTQQGIQNGGRRPSVLWLDDQLPRSGASSKNWCVEAFVGTRDRGENPFIIDCQRYAAAGLLHQRGVANQLAKLLGHRFAGDLPGQSSQARSVTTGKNDRASGRLFLVGFHHEQ